VKREFFVCTFSKNSQISIFIKIRALEADYFHACSQTDGQTWRS